MEANGDGIRWKREQMETGAGGSRLFKQGSGSRAKWKQEEAEAGENGCQSMKTGRRFFKQESGSAILESIEGKSESRRQLFLCNISRKFL